MAKKVEPKTDFRIIIVAIIILAASIAFIHFFPCEPLLSYGILAIIDAIILTLVCRYLLSGSITINSKLDGDLSVKAKGGYALFCFIVFFIFKSVGVGNCHDPFNLSIFFKYKDSTLLTRSGDSANIHYANINKTYTIQHGKIVLEDLPNNFLGDTAIIQLKAEGFMFINTATVINKVPLEKKSITLYIGRDSSLNELAGEVVDQFDGKPIIGARVFCVHIVDYTDENGQYILRIPKTKQKEQQIITVTANGYERFTQEISARGFETITMHKP